MIWKGKVLWTLNKSEPIHGNWSEYGLWTPCTKSCGNGTMRHFRFCSNPKPKYGGNNCEGKNYEDCECFNESCDDFDKGNFTVI